MASPSLCRVPDHDDHGIQWIFPSSPDYEVNVCVACIVGILEDSDAPLLKKKVAVAELLGVLSDHTAAMESLLLSDNRVALHVTNQLLGTLTGEDEELDNLSLEGAMQIIRLVKQEDMTFLLFDAVCSEAEKPCSLQKAVPMFSFLSRLLQEVPALCQILVQNHGDLIAVLCDALGCGCGNGVIQCILVGFLLLLFRTVPGHVFGNQQRHLVWNSVTGCLQQSEDFDVLLRSLGLVKVLAQPGQQCQGLDQPVLIAAARALRRCLMRKEEALRIASAQSATCLANAHGSGFSSLLLEQDFAEFLYEALITTNEVLLSSVFCCLLVLSGADSFFSKCHSVYGIEGVLRAVDQTYRHQSSSALHQGMTLLTKLLSGHHGSIPLFSKSGVLEDCLSIIKKGVAYHQHTVCLEAARAFVALLSKGHLPQSAPCQPLVAVLQALGERVLRLSTDDTSSKASTSSSSLRRTSLLELLLRAVQLCCQIGSGHLLEQPPAPGASDQGFNDFLLIFVESALLPLIEVNKERFSGFGELLDILQKLYSRCAASKLQGLSQALLACNFIQWAVGLCRKTRDTQLKVQTGKLLARICNYDELMHEAQIPELEEGLKEVVGSELDLDEQLADSDSSRHQQTALLVLLYITAHKGCLMIRMPRLAVSLGHYLNLAPNLDNSVVFRTVLYLYALCSLQADVEEDLIETGEKVLMAHLMGDIQPADYVTPTQEFYEWCLSTPSVVRAQGRKLVEWLLIQSGDGLVQSWAQVNKKQLIAMVASNQQLLQEVMDSLTDSRSLASVELYGFLEDMLVFSQDIDSKLKEPVQLIYQEAVPQLALTYFLANQPITGEDEASAAVSSLLSLYCRVKACSTETELSSTDTKLAFHVCKTLEVLGRCCPLVEATLQVLFALLNTADQCQDPTVASIVCSSEKVIRVMEEGICCDSTFLITVMILGKLSHTVVTQDIQVTSKYRVEKKHLSLITDSIPGLIASLQLWTIYFTSKGQSAVMDITVSDAGEAGEAVTKTDIHTVYLMCQQSALHNISEIQAAAEVCKQRLLGYVKEADKVLYNHLIEHPWNRVLEELHVAITKKATGSNIHCQVQPYSRALRRPAPTTAALQLHGNSP